jgi:hypothetical protein
MFMNYLTGPGLVRLYWLELLTETVGARRRAELARPSHVRTLLGWILRGLGKRLSRLGEKLAPHADPSATQFCG